MLNLGEDHHICSAPLTDHQNINWSTHLDSFVALPNPWRFIQQQVVLYKIHLTSNVHCYSRLRATDVTPMKLSSLSWMHKYNANLPRMIKRKHRVEFGFFGLFNKKLLKNKTSPV